MINSRGFKSSARTISMRWRSPTLSVVTMRLGIELEAIEVENAADFRLEVALRNLGVDAERDVFEHGQRLEQREMLEHHADAEFSRRARVGDFNRLAVPKHLARIGGKYAVDHLDQCRFSGAVFSEQRVNLTRFDRHLNVVVGQNAGESFGHANHLQARRFPCARSVTFFRTGHPALFNPRGFGRLSSAAMPSNAKTTPRPPLRRDLWSRLPRVRRFAAFARQLGAGAQFTRGRPSPGKSSVKRPLSGAV